MTDYDTFDVPDQVVRLTHELEAARLALREENIRATSAQCALRRVQSGLQEGLDEVDDEDDRWAVCDFLNAHTQWEFKATRPYRVTVKVYVTVEAKDEDEAREWAENSISVDGDGQAECESAEVVDCELDGR